eukprot:CAMPEP_0115878418 /NCGR_PEP_ID=MMETSP0287-20121206/26760_1 /TAXON_ID=412157 /ORGANISM="Chrysochromulina rotalis, Strain UIO044" /LENGTH=110 /DNA_ID=CAMNT_0003334027 /DNA_START=310 /DNA_END=644 /DNA_ORIENTATION=+
MYFVAHLAIGIALIAPTGLLELVKESTLEEASRVFTVAVLLRIAAYRMALNWSLEVSVPEVSFPEVSVPELLTRATPTGAADNTSAVDAITATVAGVTSTVEAWDAYNNE